jgi:small multidrug resistance pump
MTRWYALLGVAVLFNGLANVLMKFGMQHAPALTDATGTIKHYITSWPVITGLALFAINVIAYTQALTKLPLSIAYPIMVSMTGLIVISGSIILFKEAITWWQWMGFALIIGGVVCVTR